jgi:hypothetical protein
MRFSTLVVAALLFAGFCGCSRESIETASPKTASAKLSQTSEQGEIPPGPAAESPTALAEPLQSEAVAPPEWLQLHLTSIRVPGSPDWRNALITLKEVGDGISVEYLRKLDSSKLADDNRRALEDTIAVIQMRMEHEDDATTVALLQTRLERAAYADLMCHPMEGTLVPWTLKFISARAGHPQVRAKLMQLRSNYAPAANTETAFSSMTERVPDYITRLLKDGKDGDDGLDAKR